MWILREGLIKTGLPKSLVKRAAKCETGTNIFGIDTNLKWPFGGQTSQAKHSLIVQTGIVPVCTGTTKIFISMGWEYIRNVYCAVNIIL